MILGVPIAVWVLLGIIIYILISFGARSLTEYILKKRDIIYFAKNKTKDDYHIYFTFLFFMIYLPLINVLFIISMLIMIEVDNLKLMKFNQ